MTERIITSHGERYNSKGSVIKRGKLFDLIYYVYPETGEFFPSKRKLAIRKLCELGVIEEFSDNNYIKYRITKQASPDFNEYIKNLEEYISLVEELLTLSEKQDESNPLLYIVNPLLS